jgi:quercetin dioxygenase-like cupin family protein
VGVELDVAQPVLLRPGEGETVTDRPERTLRILVELEQVIVTWFRYEPGEEGPEPHVHRRHTDAFYVLAGELEFGLGPDIERIRGLPGTFAAAPPNVVHTFRNASDSTAVFLNIHAPSMGFGDHIRGKGEAFDQFEPPPDGGRPLSDAIVAGPGEGERLDREHGLNLIKGDLEQVSTFELVFHPGWEGVAPHEHSDHVDAFFVLDGEVDFVVGHETRRAGRGCFVAAPVGTRHGFRNPGDGTIRVFNLHAPDAGFAERLRRA